MKIFGSITELVAAVFRKNSQAITLRPNQSTTYTGARDIQTPPQDANSVLVSEDATQALSNKTISGASNTISNINLASQVTGILPTANGGTGQNSSATFPASGTIVTEAASQALTNKTIDADLNTLSNIENADIKAAAAIDASKIADGSVSSTEFQYIGGLTSDAQTQIDGKVSDTGDTMTGDLIMDNQHSVKFREQTGNGTNFIALEAPNAVTTDTTFKLPNGDGTVGQVIKTDGSGNLGWVTATTAVLYDPLDAGGTNGLVDGTNGLKGFSDGSDANAGYLGESTETQGDTSPGGSGQFDTSILIVLSPGRWLVGVQANADANATTTLTNMGIGLSTDSGTNAFSDAVLGDNYAISTVGGLGNHFLNIVPKYFSVSVSTTLYTKITSTYTGTAPSFHLRGTATRIS